VRELELNRRFAADLYLRVVAVTREEDGIMRLDGSGEVVEWALEMRRFDETCLLDAMARRGPLDADTLKALADLITPTGPRPWGGLRRSWRRASGRWSRQRGRGARGFSATRNDDYIATRSPRDTEACDVRRW
jgi:hypothetical protein